ncbi:MAG TPA: hypothetical protein VGM63_13735, partial [Mucilaginibacter sp.]
SAAPGNENIRVLSFQIKSPAEKNISISTGLIFEMTFFNKKANINLDATFELKNGDEIVVFHHGVLISTDKNSEEGFYTVKGVVPAFLLNAGTYSFKIIFGENQRYLLFGIDDFIQFEVENETKGSNSFLSPGVISPDIAYNVNYKKTFK